MGIFILLFIAAFLLIPHFLKFKSSGYQQASGNTFLKTFLNKGSYGEFLTFSQLEQLKGSFKLMTNLYLPKKDGTTTEIDLVMISEAGLYVFESKNYSGWIFGDERNKTWMQTFPNKRKEKFYNPIWQNKTHINALKSVLGIDNDSLFRSYIIFSNRCTLKKVNVTSPNVKVIKRNALIRTIKKGIDQNTKLLGPSDINRIYLALYPYSHADDSQKKLHIKQIQMKR